MIVMVDIWLLSLKTYLISPWIISSGLGGGFKGGSS